MFINAKIVSPSFTKKDTKERLQMFRKWYNILDRPQNLLVRQFKTFFRWYVVFLVLGICKVSKVLEACQEQCHCFVITSAPKQVHGTKPKKYLNQLKHPTECRKTIFKTKQENQNLNTNSGTSWESYIHLYIRKRYKH